MKKRCRVRRGGGRSREHYRQLKRIDLLFRVRHDKNLEPFLFKLVARLNDDGKLLARNDLAPADDVPCSSCIFTEAHVQNLKAVSDAITLRVGVI